MTRFSDSDLATSLQQSWVQILTRLTLWCFCGLSLRVSGPPALSPFSGEGLVGLNPVLKLSLVLLL